MKTSVSQLLRYPAVAISPFVLGYNGANLFSQFRILVRLLLLLRVVIICAARETGGV